MVQTPVAADAISFKARWVFSGAGDPIEQGVVEIAYGRIVAVHGRNDPAAIDLGPVALAPGLINAHTHLEFSDLGRPVGPSSSFTGWIRSLVSHRRSRSESLQRLLRRGLAESRAAGVVALGEIATDSHVLPTLQAAGAAGVVFRELLGLLPERADEQFALAVGHLDAAAAALEHPWAPLGAGLSPHAPYSVHPELFQRLCRLAAERAAPLAVHLAETQAEVELLQHGTGEFVEMLQSFGVWREGLIPTGSRALDYLRWMSAAPRGLVIHGNFLDDEELRFLARHPQLSVVYCPRTHAYFRHPPHPWRRMRELGINVALGTDSRGSNPDLSLWNEVGFLRRRFPQTPPATLLEMATRNGAIALGIESDVGTLVPGKRAAMTCFALPEDAPAEPWAALFDPRTVPRSL